MLNNNIFCPDPSNQKEEKDLGYIDIEDEDFNDEYEAQIQTVITELIMLSNIIKEHFNIDIEDEDFDDEEEEEEDLDEEQIQALIEESEELSKTMEENKKDLHEAQIALIYRLKELTNTM